MHQPRTIVFCTWAPRLTGAMFHRNGNATPTGNVTPCRRFRRRVGGQVCKTTSKGSRKIETGLERENVRESASPLERCGKLIPPNHQLSIPRNLLNHPPLNSPPFEKLCQIVNWPLNCPLELPRPHQSPCLRKKYAALNFDCPIPPNCLTLVNN